jgi:hypothetical protein
MLLLPKDIVQASAHRKYHYSILIYTLISFCLFPSLDKWNNIPFSSERQVDIIEPPQSPTSLLGQLGDCLSSMAGDGLAIGAAEIEAKISAKVYRATAKNFMMRLEVWERIDV